MISFSILRFPRQIKTKVFRGRLDFLLLLAKGKKNFKKCSVNSTTTATTNTNNTCCLNWNQLKPLHFYLFLFLSLPSEIENSPIQKRTKMFTLFSKCALLKLKKLQLNLTNNNLIFLNIYFYPDQQNFYHIHSFSYCYI